MKRSRINRISDKEQEFRKQWGPVRKAYAEKFHCPLTGSYQTEVHEMIGGSSRQVTRQEPCTWLALSRTAHEEVQYWPKARQMALKLIHDPENFDLERFNELYRSGGREWPVTLTQIASHLTLA